MYAGSWMILAANLLQFFTVSVKSTDSIRPNIVVVIADDMGWNDVGFHGSDQIPTPNIDALAYNGVILNRHYTLPTCTPSRTAFLTGRYPIRSGMQGVPLLAGEPRGLPLKEKLLPERLKELGYTTRIVGKWHLGCARTEFTPTKRGFDSFLGYWNGFIGYFNHTINYDDEQDKEGLDFRRDLRPTNDYEGQYATDVFTQEAVDVIRHHDKTRPLYLHLAHLAVHSGNVVNPLEVPDAEEAHRRFSHIDTPQRRLYAEMVRKLDESVGLVVTALADSGLLKNTIIIFMSDNGAQSEGILYANFGSNQPLRGMKQSLHEGGVRNVAAIWSPSFQQPGRVSNQLFHLTDWLPTLYSAAGGDVSQLADLDGVDQWASLVNNQNASPRTELLLNIDDKDKSEGLIKDKWKFKIEGMEGRLYNGYYGDSGQSPANPPYGFDDVLDSNVNTAFREIANGKKSKKSGLNVKKIRRLRTDATVDCPQKLYNNVTVACTGYCLYDIVEDPCETNNVAAANSEIVAELMKDMAKYRELMIPELNLPLDPRSNPLLHKNVWVSWLDHNYNVELRK